MGVDYEAKMIYGARYIDIVEALSQEEIDELDEQLDYCEIDYASPYCDAPRDRWIVGYELSDGFSYVDRHGFLLELEDAEKKFREKFGFIGCVYSILDVY